MGLEWLARSYSVISSLRGLPLGPSETVICLAFRDLLKVGLKQPLPLVVMACFCLLSAAYRHSGAFELPYCSPLMSLADQRKGSYFHLSDHTDAGPTFWWTGSRITALLTQGSSSQHFPFRLSAHLSQGSHQHLKSYHLGERKPFRADLKRVP